MPCRYQTPPSHADSDGNSPPTAQIYHHTSLPPRPHTLQEVPHQHINDPQTEPVAPIDEGGTALKFLDKIAGKMRFVRVVELFHTAFRDDAAVIRLLVEG